MSHLTLEGDKVLIDGPIGFQGDSSLVITLDDTGTLGFGVESLVLSGTTSVGIGSVGDPGGFSRLRKLAGPTRSPALSRTFHEKIFEEK